MTVLAMLHAAIAGFMIFFMAAVPQAAFKTLSAKAVGAFLRVLFPRLFLFRLGAGSAGIRCCVSCWRRMAAQVSAAIAVGFAINLLVLTPQINVYRDRDLEGDVGARRIFGLLHMASVGIFLAQLAGSLAVSGLFAVA